VEAVLSCKDDLTSFSVGERVIRFRTSSHLTRYARVKIWDAGYIVVDATYDNQPGEVEDYIDLIPILQNLYIDPDAFCAPIDRVEVAHA